jgi:hypothetical protein
LPAEPSSKRVLVWRHLRKLGAILDSGVWLLPSTPALEAEFRIAVAEIEELGGRPRAFRADDFAPEQHEQLREAFNRVRAEEYDELLQRCDRFIGHVERWTDENNFRFGAVEELEEDLEKRRRSLAQIASRDVFGVPLRQQVEDRVRDCESALAGFVEQVFTAVNGDAETPGS